MFPCALTMSIMPLRSSAPKPHATLDLAMAFRFLAGVKRFILWDYPRACWQYDVMVALILAFIFLTPRHWFRDQPRASNVVMLHAEEGTRVFWIEPDLLTALSESQRRERAIELLQKRAGGRVNLIRLETIFDAESEVRGYMAVLKP